MITKSYIESYKYFWHPNENLEFIDIDSCVYKLSYILETYVGIIDLPVPIIWNLQTKSMCCLLLNYTRQ